MRKLWDYDCECGERFEATAADDEQVTCLTCGSCNTTKVSGGRAFHVIVPTYPGSKRLKAGYTHTHADRPAEKNSVSVPSNKGNF